MKGEGRAGRGRGKGKGREWEGREKDGRGGAPPHTSAGTWASS